VRSSGRCFRYSGQGIGLLKAARPREPLVGLPRVRPPRGAGPSGPAGGSAGEEAELHVPRVGWPLQALPCQDGQQALNEQLPWLPAQGLPVVSRRVLGQGVPLRGSPVPREAPAGLS